MPTPDVVETVLVTGASGMLGRAICLELERRGLPVRAKSASELDITRDEQLRPAIRDVGIVINCAAFTDVDGAEESQVLANRVNGTAVGHLAAICSESGARLVHFSTDYVFNGNSRVPYPTDAPRAPINAYGRSKALGEELLEASGAEYLLIRTSWLYAPWGQNFVRTMVRLMRERDEIAVVNDQRGRPTSAEWLAHATFELLARRVRGTFHVTDDTEMTWFELAQVIADSPSFTTKVMPCTSASLSRAALRPAYSVLDIEATRCLLGNVPQTALGISHALNRM